MAERMQDGGTTQFQEYQKDASDTLFSVAYNFVRPGASKEDVAQCMARIQDANDFDFENLDVLKIPIPCESSEAKFDLESSARELADVFRNGSKYDAANALAEKLTGLVDTLGTDDRTYNKLMVRLYENLKGDPNSNVNIATEGWNEQTHTWNKAFVYDSSYPREAAVPIVQPGSTLTSIAAERLQQLRGQGFNISGRDFMGKLTEINGISDPNRIVVGQPIYLPY